MASRSGTLSTHHAIGAPMLAKTAGIFAGACAAAFTVALLNQPYFQLVNGFVHAQGAEARGLLFSSWLLLIGIPIVIRRPRAFGFTLGSISEHWRLVTGSLIVAAAITAAILLLITGPIPYSDASVFIETVDVPITEELVFRGVLLTALLWLLRRIHAPRTAVILAVVFDGVAFGLAHLANAATLNLGFVVSQATFASALGMLCAYLMVRTGSIYPAILLHAVVNGVVVAI